MKTIGEAIFAKDAEGRPLSRIGTMFFKTAGLVTKRGIHAMQRMMWIEELNRVRAEAGQEPLSVREEDEEMAESVDLIFTEDLVLIRPDPERMDLAFRADEVLQTMVPKRVIRYLNTSARKVRKALCERGENWRMARRPISQEDMSDLIEKSRVSINEKPIYYYNKAMGTRYITASGYEEVEKLDDAEYLRQVKEVISGLGKINRHGHPEVDIFPPSTPISIKKGLKMLAVDEMTVDELRRAVGHIDTEWRMSLPPELRDESLSNYDWRNAMCHVLTKEQNDTTAEEQELIAGIAPEFYRQIEWLPGARIDRGELIFDSEVSDSRVKSLIFNISRLFGELDYINIGRIVSSLARHPIEADRRGDVYIMQYHERGAETPVVQMIRLQKWGVADHLDEGKTLLQAIMESDDYSDYILDRRLMCRQLGMNLPKRLEFGYFTESYGGGNAEYARYLVKTPYFARAYVPGIATDKIPPARFHNPAFAQRFAALMGEAAALDMIVGRRNTVTRQVVFDQNYEIVRLGEDGLPSEVVVTDHAGSFVEYAAAFEGFVADYAAVVMRRKEFVADFAAFAQVYVNAFERRLADVQRTYRTRRRAFDGLFADRPYDVNGSGAYRWSCVLKRLDACDPAAVASALKAAIAIRC